MTQPPPANPHSGKQCIPSARRASTGQLGTPTSMLFLFCSFIFASLPLSHAVTPPDAVTPLTDHWPHRDTGYQLSFFLFLLSSFFLSFFLSVSSFFSSSPFLSFSLYFLVLYCSTTAQQVNNLFLFYSFTYLIVSQQFVFFFFFYSFTCFSNY
jgi:hypothetical protein